MKPLPPAAPGSDTAKPAFDFRSHELRRRASLALDRGRAPREVAEAFGIAEDQLCAWFVARNTERSVKRRGVPCDPASIFENPPPNPWQWFAVTLFLGVFAVLLPCLFIVGPLSVSNAYWASTRLGWTAVTVLIAAGMYQYFRRLTVTGAANAPSMSRTRAALASLVVAPGIGGVYAFLAPFLMHWIEREPVQVPTYVVRRAVHDGRGCPWYLDTAISARYSTILVCVDKPTYDHAFDGQRIVLEGMASWYGLEVRRLVLQN